MNRLQAIWREEDGVLSFEWTLLLTLLTFGIVGGLAAARDAIIDELGDLAEAAQGIDQSYTLPGIDLVLDLDGVPFTLTAAASGFEEVDGVDNVFTDCERDTFNEGQAPREVADDDT